MTATTLHSKYPFEYVYYFALSVQQIINEPVCSFFIEEEETVDYFAEFLDGSPNDLQEFFTTPFPKQSRLHVLCEHVFDRAIDDGIYPEADRLRGLDPDEDSVELLLTNILEAYSIPHTAFADWLAMTERTLDFSGGNSLQRAESLLGDYYQHLSDENSFGAIRRIITDEVFFLLFMNRSLLRKFNLILAERLNKSEFKSAPGDGHISSSGKIRRKRIPAWIKRAVFHRDRGRCANCLKDISGLTSIANTENYDHIVPLALGGLNDVTNFQLLCENCNKRKRHLNSEASIIYERWY